MELDETRSRLEAVQRELAKVHIGEDKIAAIDKAVRELTAVLLHTLPAAPPAPPPQFDATPSPEPSKPAEPPELSVGD